MIAQARANPWISLIDSDRPGPYHQGQYTAIRVNEVCFGFSFCLSRFKYLSIVHYHVVPYFQNWNQTKSDNTWTDKAGSDVDAAPASGEGIETAISSLDPIDHLACLWVIVPMIPWITKT